MLGCVIRADVFHRSCLVELRDADRLVEVELRIVLAQLDVVLQNQPYIKFELQFGSYFETPGTAAPKRRTRILCSS